MCGWCHSQRTLPFANRRMGKQGVFIAERHFLSVWVYFLLRVHRAPTAHEAAQPAMALGRRWYGGWMALQAQTCLSLCMLLVNLLSTHGLSINSNHKNESGQSQDPDFRLWVPL